MSTYVGCCILIEPRGPGRRDLRPEMTIAHGERETGAQVRRVVREKKGEKTNV